MISESEDYYSQGDQADEEYYKTEASSYGYYRRVDEVEEFIKFLGKMKYRVHDLDCNFVNKERLIAQWRDSRGLAPKWDKNHPEHDICKCGHYYYRHFDTYEDMYPVGCKYCRCYKFKSANIDLKHAKACYEKYKCPVAGCDNEMESYGCPFCKQHINDFADEERQDW